MFEGNAAEDGERVLQAGRQRGEALAAEHDLDVLEAGEGEREVIEPMRQRLAGDDDDEIAGVGEVGQAKAAGRVGLREDDLLLRAFSARQSRTRRSSVRRTRSPKAPGKRRSSSWSSVTGRTPGAERRIGTMTSSQTRASGSSRVRQVRGVFRAEGGVGSASMRRALATDIPALAAASFWVWVVRRSMNSLACRSVMCLPGKTAPIAGRAEHDRQAGRRSWRQPMGAQLRSGYALSPQRPHALILIAAERSR